MKNRILLALIILLVVACDPDGSTDVTAPSITEVLVNGSESSVVMAMAGDALNVSISSTDNAILSELRVIVHDADNGHVHAGNGNGGGQFHLNSGSWGVDNVYEIGAASNTTLFQLNVPDDVAGNWHLVVTALDNDGTVSLEYTVLIKVENPNLPGISVQTNPAYDADGVVHMQADSTLTLSTEVSAPNGLASVCVYPMSMLGNLGYVDSIPFLGNPTALSIPGYTVTDAPQGTYRIVIAATDVQGRRRLWDAKVIAQ